MYILVSFFSYLEPNSERPPAPTSQHQRNSKLILANDGQRYDGKENFYVKNAYDHDNSADTDTLTNDQSLQVEMISRRWNNWAYHPKIIGDSNLYYGYPTKSCTVSLSGIVKLVGKCVPRMYTKTAKPNFPEFDRNMRFQMIYKGNIPQIADNIEKFYCKYFQYPSHIPNYVTITKFEKEHNNQSDGAKWESSMARYKFDTINFFNFMYLLSNEDCGVEIPSDTHWKLFKFKRLKEIIDAFFQTIYHAKCDIGFDFTGDIFKNIKSNDTGKINDHDQLNDEFKHEEKSKTEDISEIISNLPSLNDIFAEFGFKKNVNLTTMFKEYLESQLQTSLNSDMKFDDDSNTNKVNNYNSRNPNINKKGVNLFSKNLNTIAKILIESEYVISDHQPWFVKKLTDKNIHNLREDIIQAYLFCDKLAQKVNVIFQVGFSIDHPLIDCQSAVAIVDEKNNLNPIICARGDGLNNTAIEHEMTSTNNQLRLDINITHEGDDSQDVKQQKEGEPVIQSKKLKNGYLDSYYDNNDPVTFVGAPWKVFTNNWDYIKIFAELSCIVNQQKQQSDDTIVDTDIDDSLLEKEIKKRFAIYIDDQIDLIHFQLNETIKLIPDRKERMLWWNIITHPNQQHLTKLLVKRPIVRGRQGYYQNKWYENDTNCNSCVAVLPRLYDKFEQAYKAINLPHLNPVV